MQVAKPSPALAQRARGNHSRPLTLVVGRVIFFSEHMSILLRCLSQER
jgi:hypothetical protein